jgi:hypothetical protein
MRLPQRAGPNADHSARHRVLGCGSCRLTVPRSLRAASAWPRASPSWLTSACEPIAGRAGRSGTSAATAAIDGLPRRPHRRTARLCGGARRRHARPVRGVRGCRRADLLGGMSVHRELKGGQRIIGLGVPSSASALDSGALCVDPEILPRPWDFPWSCNGAEVSSRALARMRLAATLIIWN